jgi:hypothetical protein
MELTGLAMNKSLELVVHRSQSPWITGYSLTEVLGQPKQENEF